MTIESTTARGPRIVYVGSASRPAHSVDDLHAVLGARSGDTATGHRPAGVSAGPAPGSDELAHLFAAAPASATGWPAPESLMRTWPWCAVGRVESGYVDATGKHWTSRGTGTLVGRNVVLTAGHNLPWKYAASGNRYVDFYPGYYRGTGPSGPSAGEGWWGTEDETPDDNERQRHRRSRLRSD